MTDKQEATQYRNHGAHAVEVAIGDKRVMVEPGGFVEYDDEPDNKYLVDDGVLVKVPAKSK